MINTPLNVFIPVKILQVGFWGSVMHNCFSPPPNILVGPPLAFFSMMPNMGSVSTSLGFHILHAGEGNNSSCWKDQGGYLFF